MEGDGSCRSGGGVSDADGRGQQQRQGRAVADVAVDGSSVGGCGIRPRRHFWLSSASADSDGDGGRRGYLNNGESGRVGEDGGESSEIFDYNCMVCRVR